MLDIKYIREHAEVVKAAAKNKNVDVDVDILLSLDADRRTLIASLDTARARQNKVSAEIPKLDVAAREVLVKEMQDLKEVIKQEEERFNEVESRYTTLLKQVPNIPADDVPVGATEDENVVVKEVGEVPQFGFEVKNHWQIAERLDLIDKKRAANISGARFAYMKGSLVRAQLGLVQWVMSVLTNEAIIKEIIEENNLKLSSTPFVPVLPPLLIRTEPYDAMDRLEPRDDRYKIEGEELWLQGSAEHVLGSMYADETFEETQLPIRYLGYATSFRKEAGTYGKDMEGIFRMHQFDKMEMEVFSTPETSADEHLLLVAIQEYLVQQLGLPYRVLLKCTADIGKPNARGIDIETWLPGQGKYRETHTADLMTDYQARRLNTRVRRGDGRLDFVHTNDATAFALGRIFIAILENYQQEDGSVMIPAVLVPYCGFQEIR